MSIRDARDSDSRVRDGRLSTGIDVLDEDLLRGVPEGSTIAIIGDPVGMGSLIPAYLPLTGRDTQYISTTQTVDGVKRRLRQLRDYPDEEDGGLPDTLSIEDTISGTDSTEDELQKYMNRIDEGDNIIVDTMSSVRDSDEFGKLARSLQTQVRRKGGLGYMYFAVEDQDELSRKEREVIHQLDGVWRVEQGLTGDTIETRLFITKQNGCELPESIIKLNVGPTLTVDTTRDIA